MADDQADQNRKQMLDPRASAKFYDISEEQTSELQSPNKISYPI